MFLLRLHIFGERVFDFQSLFFPGVLFLSRPCDARSRVFIVFLVGCI